MYTPPSDVLLNKTILLVNEWDVLRDQKEFEQSQCPVNRCILTMNQREADTTDAILFKNSFTTLFAKRPPNQVSVVGQIFVYRYIYLLRLIQYNLYCIINFRYGSCTIQNLHTKLGRQPLQNYSTGRRPIAAILILLRLMNGGSITIPKSQRTNSIETTQLTKPKR